jgi:hypothetical protein
LELNAQNRNSDSANAGDPVPAGLAVCGSLVTWGGNLWLFFLLWFQAFPRFVSVSDNAGLILNVTFPEKSPY